MPQSHKTFIHGHKNGSAVEVQVAPQETEIPSYVIGGTKQDVAKIHLKRMTMSSLKFGKRCSSYCALEQTTLRKLTIKL